MIKLKLPRKSRSYYSSYYNGFKPAKSRPKISPLWILLSLPVLIVLLELLAQAYLGITGKGNQIAGNSPLFKAYQLQFLTEDRKPIEGLVNQGNLKVTRSPATSYQLASNQKNQFLQINEQGFRDSQPLPLAKPKNEIRIFILGGSTAFGQGNPNNEATISHQLETRLQQRVAQQKNAPQEYRPDVFPFFVPTRQQLMKLPPKIRSGQYRVINAAVPGYTSGNQLAQLALEILPYQPDLIVVLDGYEDIMLPSSQSQTEIPQIDAFLENAGGHFRTAWNQSFNQWLHNTGIVKTIASFSKQTDSPPAQSSLATNLEDKSLKSYLPNQPKELQHRVTRYRNNHKQLIQMAAKSGVPVILAVQPEITSRPADKLAPSEKNIRDQLGQDYTQKMPQAYGELVKTSQQLAQTFPTSVKVINFENEAALPTPMFADAVHVNEKANAAIADQLYHAITAWEKIQIIPQNFHLKN